MEAQPYWFLHNKLSRAAWGEASLIGKDWAKKLEMKLSMDPLALGELDWLFSTDMRQVLNLF